MREGIKQGCKCWLLEGTPFALQKDHIPEMLNKDDEGFCHHLAHTHCTWKSKKHESARCSQLPVNLIYRSLVDMKLWKNLIDATDSSLLCRFESSPVVGSIINSWSRHPQVVSSIDNL